MIQNKIEPGRFDQAVCARPARGCNRRQKPFSQFGAAQGPGMRLPGLVQAMRGPTVYLEAEE